MWPFRKPVQDDPVPKLKQEPKLKQAAKPALNISAMDVAQARAKQPKFDTFATKPPPPGVLPDAKMAMDWNGSSLQGYASQYGAGEYQWLSYPYLAELAQLPEYRRPIETQAREMTRKWIRFTATGDDDKADKIVTIEAAFKRFKIKEHFTRCAELDGYFGRGHLYIDTGATENPDELRTPLTINRSKVRKNSIKAFKVIEPIWTYPAAYNAIDPLKPDYYKPQSWFVMGKEVHASRLLTFIGHEVPDLLKAAYQFGGISMSQMLKPYVDKWLRSQQSVSDLIHSFSTGVLATNLQASLGGGGSQVLNRLELFNLYRDNQGTLAIDKDTEDYKNISAPLGSLDKLQAQSQEHMCAVTGQPLIVTFGLTPSGLNASSDGEIRVFQDMIHAFQPHLFGANLDKVLGLIQLNEFGEIDPQISYEWVDLWTLDEAAKAVVEKTKADIDALNIQEGIISPDEARSRIAADPLSMYPGLDADLPAPGPPAGEESGEADIHGDPAMRALSSGERASSQAF